jgi:hypothetical protein
VCLPLSTWAALARDKERALRSVAVEIGKMDVQKKRRLTRPLQLTRPSVATLLRCLAAERQSLDRLAIAKWATSAVGRLPEGRTRERVDMREPGILPCLVGCARGGVVRLVRLSLGYASMWAQWLNSMPSRLSVGTTGPSLDSHRCRQLKRRSTERMLARCLGA